MSEGPGWDDALLGMGDRTGFRGAYPDGQEAFSVDLPEQDYRLVRRHLYPDTNDVELAHSSTVPRSAPGRSGDAPYLDATGPGRP
ncbi:hypothetical protein GCM10023317_37930 [Actinopolymorpha pittospori]